MTDERIWEPGQHGPLPSVPDSGSPPGAEPVPRASQAGTPLRGDFGLQRGVGWEMAVVRYGTLSRYGHACLAVEDAAGETVRIVEAMPDGVRARTAPVDEWVWSNIALTDQQRTDIAATATGELGRPYDWGSILLFVLRHLGAHLRGRSDNHADDHLICSELVVWAYGRAGVDLAPGWAPGDVSPGDLADYLVKH